uniref:Uncharacterized protein n=1 Tax=Arundo donax TaxID=35708 RepID=A0A0A8ZS53_ARUDO
MDLRRHTDLSKLPVYTQVALLGN